MYKWYKNSASFFLLFWYQRHISVTGTFREPFSRSSLFLAEGSTSDLLMSSVKPLILCPISGSVLQMTPVQGLDRETGRAEAPSCLAGTWTLSSRCPLSCPECGGLISGAAQRTGRSPPPGNERPSVLQERRTAAPGWETVEGAARLSAKRRQSVYWLTVQYIKNEFGNFVGNYILLSPTLVELLRSPLSHTTRLIYLLCCQQISPSLQNGPNWKLDWQCVVYQELNDSLGLGLAPEPNVQHVLKVP